MRGTFIWLCLIGLLPQVTCAAEKVSYATPPRCLVWLEGEDCSDHNWIEGPTDNCWAFGWAGVHGGVLDLAHWRLPAPDRPYYARFRFELSDSGQYVAYYLGRIPGCLASPLEWSLDEGPPTELKAPDGWNVPGALDVVASFKYALVRLGSFAADAGKHVLTFTVRKTVPDFGIAEMYSAQIDAIGIAPADWPVESMVLAPRPEASGSPASPMTKDEPAREPVVLEAGQLRVELSPVNAGIRRLTFGREKREVLAEAQAAQSPIEVDFRDGSSSDSGRVTRITRDKHGLLLRLEARKLVTELCLTADPTACEVRIRPRLHNRTGSDIWQVCLKVSESLGVGGEASDDTWLVGKEVLPPASTQGSHSWIAPYQFPFELVAISDQRATLYALIEDRRLLDTRVKFGRPAGALGGLSFIKYPRVQPGAVRELPPLIIGAYAGGDWHPAGDRFSRWWYTWAETPETPEWLARLGGISVGGPDMQAPEAAQKAIDELVAMERVSGIQALHGAGWFSFRTECWYPTQWRLSPDQLRNVRLVTDTVRAHDGRTSIYTNPLMLSRATPDYELWGREAAVIDAKGRVQLTEHNTHHHPMALPYPNEALAARYLAILQPVLQLGKPDLLYMDQLGAVPAHLDFAARRGEDLTDFGRWVRGSTRFVRLVHESLAVTCPHLATWIECPNPALLQYVHLSYYGTNRVLRYVFPTYYGFVGDANSLPPEQAVQVAQEGLLTGQPVAINHGGLAQAEPTHQQAVREIVKLKQLVDPLLRTAKFRDQNRLMVSEGVDATLFVGRDRVFIPFVRKMEGTTGVVRCELAALPGKRAQQAHAYVVGSEATSRAEMRREDGWLAVTLPTSRAGVIEIK